MNLVAQIALYAAIPLCILPFALLKPRHAVMVAYLGAWMFLPVAAIKMKGAPDLTKITAASVGVLMGAMLFDFRTLIKFRPKWFDIPMAVMVFSPFLTSVKNDLGEYDGLANIFFQVVTWGIPYFIGRCYFTDWASFRELGIAIVIGGLIYVPFCMLEMRISPQLHKWVYGRHAHAFGQEVRWGGYRPQVFMQSGLAVGKWMTAAALVATWLWISGSVKKLFNIPMAWLVPVLILTAIFCKATAAIMFLMVGLATLFWIKYLRNPVPLIALLIAAPVYMYQRTTQNWDGTWITEQAYKTFGQERGQSLETRIEAENRLTAHALDAPDRWFGWGKWDKNNPGMTPWRIYKIYDKYRPGTESKESKFVVDERTGQIVKRTRTVVSPGTSFTVIRDNAITDGLWVITLGTYGLTGLIALTATLLLPAVIMMVRVPMKFWDHPMTAAATALSVVTTLDMLDNILNGMLNPVFVLAVGGICAVGPSVRKMWKAHRQQLAAGYVPAAAAPSAAGYAPAAAQARPAAARPAFGGQVVFGPDGGADIAEPAAAGAPRRPSWRR